METSRHIAHANTHHGDDAGVCYYGRKHYIACCCGSLVVYTWEHFLEANKGITVFISPDVHDVPLDTEYAKHSVVELDNGDNVYIKEASEYEAGCYGENRDAIPNLETNQTTPYASVYMTYAARFGWEGFKYPNNPSTIYTDHFEELKKKHDYFFFIVTPEMELEKARYSHLNTMLDFFGKEIYRSASFACNNNTDEPSRLSLIIRQKV